MAPSESQLLDEIVTLRREALGVRLAMALVGAGVAVAVLDNLTPFAWAGAVVITQYVDVSLFSWVASRGPLVSDWRSWLLRVSTFLASAVMTSLAAVLWFHGGTACAAAAATLWCAYVFRDAADMGARRDLVYAALAPHLGVMLIVPWAAAMARPSGFMFEKEIVLCAQVLFVMNTGVFLSRQEEAAARANEALREARLEASRARVLFDQATTSAALLDRDLRYLAVSRRFCEIFETTEQEALGRYCLDVAPWTPAHWTERLQRALAGERVVIAEDETKWPNGRTAFSRIEFVPWLDEEHRIRGVCVYGNDITKFVKERQEKEAASRRLALALHNISAAVWELDVENKQVIGAERLGEVFATRPTYVDMAALNQNTVHPEHRERLLAAVQRATRTGERYSIEYPLISEDSTIRWAHTNGEAFADEHGKLTRIVALSMDITERKRLELDLIETMRRAEKSLLGKRALLSAITRDIGGAEAQREAPLRAPEPSGPTGDGFEELYQRLDRLIEEIDARDRALAEAVQALREARQAAESANESKSMFLANMSHELRTPLNAVIGYAEILEEDLAPSGLETSIKDAGRIRVSARHLLSLINEILDLSKIEAGKMDLVLGDLDIASLVQEAMDTVLPTAQAKNNRIELAVDDDIGTVRADSLRVRQCVLNLLSNACKFTENGAVTIRLTSKENVNGRWLHIEVADTGIGMTEAQIARLFQPFTQADSSTTRKFGGTGLGLALTRRLAQLMGGDITVTSAPERGSTFTMVLPIAGPSVQARRSSTGQRPIVLVIEDDALARDQARRALSPLGFDVRFAVTGEEGLQSVTQEAPALILLDIRLPDQSGWDVLSALKLTPAFKDIPVIIASADDNRAQSLALGAREHLVKPLDRERLALAAVKYAGVSTDASEAPPLMRA